MFQIHCSDFQLSKRVNSSMLQPCTIPLPVVLNPMEVAIMRKLPHNGETVEALMTPSWVRISNSLPRRASNIKEAAPYLSKARRPICIECHALRNSERSRSIRITPFYLTKWLVYSIGSKIRSKDSCNYLKQWPFFHNIVTLIVSRLVRAAHPMKQKTQFNSIWTMRLFPWPATTWVKRPTKTSRCDSSMGRRSYWLPNFHPKQANTNSTLSNNNRFSESVISSWVSVQARRAIASRGWTRETVSRSLIWIILPRPMLKLSTSRLWFNKSTIRALWVLMVASKGQTEGSAVSSYRCLAPQAHLISQLEKSRSKRSIKKICKCWRRSSRPSPQPPTISGDCMQSASKATRRISLSPRTRPSQTI